MKIGFLGGECKLRGFCKLQIGGAEMVGKGVHFDVSYIFGARVYLGQLFARTVYGKSCTKTKTKTKIQKKILTKMRKQFACFGEHFKEDRRKRLEIETKIIIKI